MAYNKVALPAKDRQHQLVQAINMLDQDGVKVVKVTDLIKHVMIAPLNYSACTFKDDIKSLTKKGIITSNRTGKDTNLALIKNRHSLGQGVSVSTRSTEPTEQKKSIIPVRIEQGIDCVTIMMPTYMVQLHVNGSIQQLPYTNPK